ncbi:MAG: hypothetical protein JWO96_131 [Candidatus Saccharibacteria bacterium]|nr:hypothetical protein [Candidatus Saccharibacteria bacterium]
MKYTLRSGVEHPFSEKFTDNRRFILPLLGLLVLIIFLGLLHAGKFRSGPRPLTLGIYTVKTPGSSSSDSGTGSTNNQGNPGGGSSMATSFPSDGTAANPQAATVLANATGSSTTPSSGTPVATGGMGGGSLPVVQGGGTPMVPPPIVSTPPPPPPPPAAVLPYVLCSPALDLQTGGKRVLAADGTCITVN